MPDHSWWNNRRVLLTGHTGFKGSWLSLWLHALGARVTGCALEPPTTPSLYEQARVAVTREPHHTLIAEAEFLQQSDRAGVFERRDRDHTLQPERLRGQLQAGLRCLERVAAPAVPGQQRETELHVRMRVAAQQAAHTDRRAAIPQLGQKQTEAVARVACERAFGQIATGVVLVAHVAVTDVAQKIRIGEQGNDERRVAIFEAPQTQPRALAYDQAGTAVARTPYRSEVSAELCVEAHETMSRLLRTIGCSS